MQYERGYDPYDKRDVCPDWLVNPFTEDVAPYVAYIKGLQDSFERATNRFADQLLNPGYDPYNATLGAGLVFRVHEVHSDGSYTYSPLRTP